MKLTDGLENGVYLISSLDLPLKTAKRLEALGMIRGTQLSLLKKKPSALVVAIRGSRFALGRAIASNIEVEGV